MGVACTMVLRFVLFVSDSYGVPFANLEIHDDEDAAEGKWCRRLRVSLI